MCSRSVHYIIQKTLITNKCTKRVLSSIVTRSYMFRPCWVIVRENFFVTVTLRLHFIVEWECAVDCVLRCFWRRELSAVRASSPELQARTYSWVRTCCWLCTALFLEAWTAHSHSSIKCNLGVTTTESSPWRWPSWVETCRSVLRLMIKLSLCICWWLVFLYCIRYCSQHTVTSHHQYCGQQVPTSHIPTLCISGQYYVGKCCWSSDSAYISLNAIFTITPRFFVSGFSFRLSTINIICISLLAHVLRSWPPHRSWLDHPNNLTTNALTF
jgi:hypothetical protein